MNFWDPNTSSKLIIFITNGSKFKGTPDTCLISKDLGHPYFERLPNTINIHIYIYHIKLDFNVRIILVTPRLYSLT